MILPVCPTRWVCSSMQTVTKTLPLSNSLHHLLERLAATSRLITGQIKKIHKLAQNFSYCHISKKRLLRWILPCNKEGGSLFLKGWVWVWESFIIQPTPTIIYSSKECTIDICALHNFMKPKDGLLLAPYFWRTCWSEGLSKNTNLIFKFNFCRSSNFYIVIFFAMNLLF